MVVSRPAPFALEVLPLAVALNDGLNASFWHSVTWNGVETFCVAPNVEVRVDSVANVEQLVGLNRNPCLLTDTRMFRNRIGTPLTIVGRTLVVVTWSVYGLTLSVARVVTGPRLNGPATAGTTTDR